MEYGTLLARGGDYFGAVVNVSSRLTRLADSSDILTSSAVRDDCQRHPEDLSFDVVGARSLRGVEAGNAVTHVLAIKGLGLRAHRRHLVRGERRAAAFEAAGDSPQIVRVASLHSFAGVVEPRLCVSDEHGYELDRLAMSVSVQFLEG